ncbi:uncharacterized protein GIQ15_04986 [Arthroderma uncinatum]|uniref:uncharacterized protein n=1 Tax=Arthroderma uncinatum TaxID=74035 RepID=UPI00144AC862|nr:uncharacterized protein GIQ15_04986 [Arthroderma uncinatum]KAF3482227.1 hypothetical protein GIQ15_04986 [Arthroderma uncinatum]
MAAPVNWSGGRWRGKPRGSRGRGIGEAWRANRGIGEGEGRRRPCRFIEYGKKCPYGKECTYSHDANNKKVDKQQPAREPADTLKEQQDRRDYNSWKRILKVPPQPNDTATIATLWTGALDILNGADRNWKQMLPRDLDEDENYGRDHIHTLLSMVSSGRGCGTFVALAQPFLSVITHPAMLDCLSVDTFVGGLYNFISGSNGQRAVGFFQRLCTSLIDAYPTAKVSKPTAEDTLLAMGAALREVLRREQRAVYHEELPDLVSSLELAATALELDETSMVRFQGAISEIKAMILRASGLLGARVEPASDISTTVKSTYPREIVVPGTRHDNDSTDIAKIKILPTKDEIRSDQPDFLPTTDRDQPHFLTDAVERHLDTLFRLLRHDIFGELKEALGVLVHAISDDPTVLRSPRPPLGVMRAYSYPNAYISYVSFDQKRGIESHVSFDQLPTLRKKSASDRSRWWEGSKRLEEGVLLCFVTFDSGKASLLFLTVSKKGTDHEAPHSLGSHERISTITTRLTTHNQADFDLLTQLSCRGTHGALIEFPGILLATFIPILENLQKLQRSSHLPFRQWILPDPSTTSTGPIGIPPPLYARGQRFSFPLDSILKTKGDKLSLSPNVTLDDDNIINDLETRTSLDKGQCRALIAGLTREFAFIQGPPGTGKSYIGVHLMRVLLACKERSKLGPVVVICYTNHALDQFLEGLVEAGIKKLVRIGGQSKSKALKGNNLRVVSRGEAKTRSERYLAAKTYEALRNKEPLITKVLGALHASCKRRGWKELKGHLQWKYPSIFSQFSRFDEDSFKTVGKEPFDVWSEGTAVRQPDGGSALGEVITTSQDLVLAATQNVHGLSTLDRHRLVEFWVQEVYESNTDELFELVKESHQLYERLDKIHDEVDRRVLETADVIGITTTGLAKRISVLRHIPTKVVICEEAGEVMEPHIISALLPSVEHFIQIGDHQQLRPQINNYGLSLESKQGELYQLDRSQFERLSVGEPGRASFPVAQLDTQRRMRPEISTLIRETLYPRLIDHESTKNMPDVVGMRKNVFWLDHENMENSPSTDRHQKSHSNDWEVDMTHSLVRHIVRQGVYNSHDIAVLTPYTGQLQKLRAKMMNDFEIVLSDRDQEVLARDGFDDGILTPPEDNQMDSIQARSLEKKKLSEFLRIATVDNFQGEERCEIFTASGAVSAFRRKSRIAIMLWKSRVVRMYPLPLSSALRHVKYLYLVAIAAQENVVNAIIRSERQNTESVTLFAGDALEPATIHVQGSAMMVRIVGLVFPPARLNVLILNANYVVMNLVHHALKAALGRANTEGIAKCPALHLVTVFHAINVAQNSFPVVINAQESVARNVLKVTATTEINVDESPIVVLGCGHFFTTESLDGIMSMAEFYKLDPYGEFTGLEDISATFVQAVPCCPDCKRSVRQFATQRYNRVVNRAVIDEMSKRFISSGRDGLQELEEQIGKLEKQLHESRDEIMERIRRPNGRRTSSVNAAMSLGIDDKLRERRTESKKLESAIKAFRNNFADKYQPAQKLHEASICMARKAAVAASALDVQLANLNLVEATPALAHDSRIIMGGQMAQIKTEFLILEDEVILSKALNSMGNELSIKFPRGPPSLLVAQFLQKCEIFIAECDVKNLPKLSVEVTLFYTRIARSFEYLSRSTKTDLDKSASYVGTANKMLEKALEVCQIPFHNAKGLRAAVEESIRYMAKEWYEEVTQEEVEAVKAAMVSGSGGIATHSGHWYLCKNGHPFAIGECGMPMQLATCPECGAVVGGQNHTAVEGVTRAVNMEG